MAVCAILFASVEVLPIPTALFILTVCVCLKSQNAAADPSDYKQIVLSHKRFLVLRTSSEDFEQLFLETTFSFMTPVERLLFFSLLLIFFCF